MEQKLNVNLTGDKEKVVLEIREGDALTLNEPKQYQKGVTLSSLGEWVGKRQWNEDMKLDPAVVHFSKDPEKAMVQLLHNPNDVLATVLTADLIINPDFVAFGINKDKQFTQKELEKHVRKYAHCFKDVETAKKLINDLRNFEVRYEQTVAKEDNRQGQKKDHYDEAIKFAKGELPKTLELRLPLFKNTEPVDVIIEVEVDKQSHSNLPLFSFYSMDVELSLRSIAEKLIKEVVDELKKSFPCLEVQ